MRGFNCAIANGHETNEMKFILYFNFNTSFVPDTVTYFTQDQHSRKIKHLIVFVCFTIIDSSLKTVPLSLLAHLETDLQQAPLAAWIRHPGYWN